MHSYLISNLSLTEMVRYASGDVLISFAGALPHRVSEWRVSNGDNTLEEGLTPGRIASVFFFPENSLHLLKNKLPMWGKSTAYGRYYKAV